MKKVLLGHGSGGKLTRDLIRELFLPHLSSISLADLTDSAIVGLEEAMSALAFTTDSYIIRPPFFPGGDIGKLAVCGTINDLAVIGAKPLVLSLALIIEEGFPLSDLQRIMQSIQVESESTSVPVVTGDTKVGEKGSIDKIFINTSGVGIFSKGRTPVTGNGITVGDKVLVSGTIGEHGIAVVLARGELQFASELESDCAALSTLVETMLATRSKIKFMRDPTRGGIATTLNEIVEDRNFGILLREDLLPIREETRTICELLGFDPLYLANEGRVVTVVAAEDAEKLLVSMRTHPFGQESQIIGEVIAAPSGKVFLETTVGGTRIVDLLVSDQLPRIC